MDKEDRRGDKDKAGRRDSGKVEVDNKDKVRCKEDNSIAQHYMHMDPIYLLRKQAPVVQF